MTFDMLLTHFFLCRLLLVIILYRVQSNPSQKPNNIVIIVRALYGVLYKHHIFVQVSFVFLRWWWENVNTTIFCLPDCSYCVHHKCLQDVHRLCAHIVTTEQKIPLENISPEIGLARQSYKCAECETPLNFSKWVNEFNVFIANFSKNYCAIYNTEKDSTLSIIIFFKDKE